MGLGKWTAVAGLLIVAVARAQQPGRITGEITKGERPVIAVPDFRGSGDAQKQMATFNKVAWDELSGAALIKLAPKDFYPAEIPQQPSDFRPPKTIRSGPWLTDWSGPPPSANFLAFGYSAVQGDRLAVYAWLFNLARPDVASAQIWRKVYFGSLDAAGATSTAREFAADILQYFGIKSLMGTKIYFTSDRGGSREIWSMDYDGSNQQQLTKLRSPVKTSTPAVSPDGRTYAAITYSDPLTIEIILRSAETNARLPFRTPKSSLVMSPEFTPDGQHLLFSMSLPSEKGDENWVQICRTDLKGGEFQRLSHTRASELEARVNPKNGSDVLFISDTSGLPQLWRMNIAGTDRERLTGGQGNAANPAWSPDGQHLAFSWTLGYERGGYNVFVMDVANHEYVQLTHGEGANEHPWWAPDGAHIVFSSNRGGTSQIYTMRADGTDVRQLTRQGQNTQPVWAGGIK